MKYHSPIRYHSFRRDEIQEINSKKNNNPYIKDWKKKEKKERRTFELSNLRIFTSLSEIEIGMQLHDGVEEERSSHSSSATRFQERDEGFKQRIKKEGRIGARSPSTGLKV